MVALPSSRGPTMRSVTMPLGVAVLLAVLAWFVAGREPRPRPTAVPGVEASAVTAPQERDGEADGVSVPAAGEVEPALDARGMHGEAAAAGAHDAAGSESPDDVGDESAARGPRVRGSLVLPTGFTSEQFRVTYRRSGGADALPIHLNARGVFRLFLAEPGPVQVFVHLLGDPSPLRVVPDVRVPAEGTNDDPRLQGIEFPELRHVDLAVVDGDGQPIRAMVAVLVLPPRGHLGRRYSFGSRTDVRVPARERPQRMQVWSPGRAAVEVEVHEKATVTLPAPAVVVLEVELDEALLDAGPFEVTLEPVAEGALATAKLPPRASDTVVRVADGSTFDVAVGRQPIVVSGRRSRASGEITCALPGRYRVVCTTRPGARPWGEAATFDVELGARHELRVRLRGDGDVSLEPDESAEAGK